MRESRRDFLRKAPKRVALVGSITQSLFTSGCDTLPKVDRSYETEEVITSVVEGSAFGIGSLLFTVLSNKLGLRTGNAGAKEFGETTRRKQTSHPQEARQMQTMMDVIGIAVVPPIEEYFFRAWPSNHFLGENKGVRWDVGLPMSLLFAVSHNISPIRLLEGKLPVNFDTVPIQQFVGGMVFWKKFRETNLITVSAMHIASNAASYGFAHAAHFLSSAKK